MTAIHRIIEQHAAVHGDLAALADQQDVLTYRELNQRANAVARCLIGHGFRRGATAVINMPRSTHLAVICLGVLKAGGACTWLDGDATWPHGVSIPQGRGNSDEMKVLAIDLTSAMHARAQSSANLPILTRGSDIACVLDGVDGHAVHVPHATIAALSSSTVPARTVWSDESGVLDLWVGLMAGATVLMAPRAVLTAA